MFRTIHASETVLGFSVEIEYNTPTLEISTIEIKAANQIQAYRKWATLAFDLLKANVDQLWFEVQRLRAHYLEKNWKGAWMLSYWELFRLKEQIARLHQEPKKYCQLIQELNLQFLIPNENFENKELIAETVQNIETITKQLLSTIQKLNNETTISIRRLYRKTRCAKKGVLRYRPGRRSIANTIRS